MTMKLTQRQQIIIGSITALGVFVILFISGLIPGISRQGFKKVELVIAGIDDSRTFGSAIAQFQEKFPNITVKYEQINPHIYEETLLNNLAANKAPDIFMFHNSWLPKHFNKIIPISNAQMTIGEFDVLYPTAIRQDFAPDQAIFALPLYLDTLVLFYNKDIFDAAGIALPPRLWTDVQNLITKLRVIDSRGALTRPAIGIGGSPRNLLNATDILTLLMLQSGTPMVDDRFTRATFANQGLGALNFYVSFADPKNASYTWDKFQQFSFDLFAQGKLPMMFGYRSQEIELKKRAPHLSFGVAPIPQLSGVSTPVALPDYYGLAVSSESKNQQEAWQFITFLATDPSRALQYAQAKGQSPALRALINASLNKSDIGVYARQALIARSWPRANAEAIKQSFSNMIESVLEGRLRADQAIRQAENEVTRLMQLFR